MRFAMPVTAVCTLGLAVGANCLRGDDQPNEHRAEPSRGVASRGRDCQSPAYRTAAELFRQLQKSYDAGLHEDVICFGQQVATLDRYGQRFRETASVYAILAGSHAILGRNAEEAGDLKGALGHFKKATSCNRAFADAMGFWYRDPVYSRNPEGIKKHIDAVQKMYE
jgi:hypothetical protein